MQSGMHLYPIDGAVHRIGPRDSAFSYRDTRCAMVIFAVDPDPANAERLRTWTVEYWEALHPYSAGGAYVNFMMEEGQARVKATYRENCERLAKIKHRYDPKICSELIRTSNRLIDGSAARCCGRRAGGSDHSPSPAGGMAFWLESARAAPRSAEEARPRHRH